MPIQLPEDTTYSNIQKNVYAILISCKRRKIITDGLVMLYRNMYKITSMWGDAI